MKNVQIYLKKNWKTVVLILIILGLLLFNVKQYQGSQNIVKENQKINAQYQALLEKEKIYNQEIFNYKEQISKKDSAIAFEKDKISKTETKLQVSQIEARRLSNKLKNLSSDETKEDFKDYIESCDSLSLVAPILADQVDSLKKDNKDLITSMEQKSAFQDSIIAIKDTIIKDTKVLLASSVESNNFITEKFKKVEIKYNKEKQRKTFWKKASIVLATVGTIFIIK